MTDLTIGAELVGDDKSVDGRGVAIQIGSRMFLVAYGVVKNE